MANEWPDKFVRVEGGLPATPASSDVGEPLLVDPHKFSKAIHLLMHVQDVKTAADGGTFTQDAWQVRDLNTVQTNEISGASLASNQVTLPAGTYWVEWSAPAHSVDQHITRLYDTTNVAELLRGSSMFTGGGVNAMSHSLGTGRFTLSGTAVLELQHACDVTKTTNGFGIQCVSAILNVSGDELYSDIRFWRLF